MREYVVPPGTEDDLAGPCGDDCVFLRCDGPEDCAAGEVCRRRSVEGTRGFQCVASDACDPLYGVIACHTDADCPPCTARCKPFDLTAPLTPARISMMACQ
jgi:hypothetical protein